MKAFQMQDTLRKFSQGEGTHWGHGGVTYYVPGPGAQGKSIPKKKYRMEGLLSRMVGPLLRGLTWVSNEPIA